MIKYEFMRAHGKGSEGSEKKGGCENKKGVRKKGGCTQHRHPPPVYAPENDGKPTDDGTSSDKPTDIRDIRVHGKVILPLSFTKLLFLF